MLSVWMIQVDSSLHIGEQFTVKNIQVVFDVDALTTSHPMFTPVNKRNDINELFDSIPYSKGKELNHLIEYRFGKFQC